MNTKITGNEGELRAATYLESKGFKIIDIDKFKIISSIRT